MPIKHPREKEDIAHSFGLHYLVSVLPLNRVRRYGAVKKEKLLTNLYGGGTLLIKNRLRPNTTMDDTHDSVPPI